MKPEQETREQALERNLIASYGHHSACERELAIYKQISRDAVRSVVALSLPHSTNPQREKMIEAELTRRYAQAAKMLA